MIAHARFVPFALVGLLLLAGCSDAKPARVAAEPTQAARACGVADFSLVPGTEGATGSGVLYSEVKATGPAVRCDVHTVLTFTLLNHRTARPLQIPHNPLMVPVSGSFPGSFGSPVIVWGEPYCATDSTDLLVKDSLGHHSLLTNIVTARCDPATEHGTGPGLSVVHPTS